MERRRLWIIWINLLGGAAVLGSYAWGFLSQPVAMSSLWGGIPESARTLYTLNMFLAAGGYFFFTPYLVFGLSTTDTRIAGRFDFTAFIALYVAILVPSALWLPFMAWLIESPGPMLWGAIRLVLTLVAMGSLGLVFAIYKLDTDWTRGRIAALVGLVPFCLQTVVLDAVVWPAHFTLPPD
ncbi:hypothetical protein MK489_01950 [Myxococcota bacterium]|nr:hypothetical protein [Myxococcota bacterium]